MNKTEKDTWQNLLSLSAPTFAGEEMPFGFMTSALAGLRFQATQVAELEQIGWRALLASLAALGLAVVLSFTVTSHDRSLDLDPGVRSLVQMENISVS